MQNRKTATVSISQPSFGWLAIWYMIMQVTANRICQLS